MILIDHHRLIILLTQIVNQNLATSFSLGTDSNREAIRIKTKRS